MTTHHHAHVPAHVRHRDRIGTHRAREARLITTTLTAVCTVGFLTAVIPGVETAVTVGLLGLLALVLAVLALRWLARWLRERREDRHDAVTAARWRAVHAPHLLTPTDRAMLDQAGRRIAAGVA